MIWTAIGHQLGYPRGIVGQTLGWTMRLLNARPNALAVEALGLLPTDRVLELGCGPGAALQLLAARLPAGSAHGIDQSATMLAQARRRNRRAVRHGRVRLYRARFEELPFADQSVDKVLAVNVAHFWHDADAVLREARRVLRPGGIMAIYVTETAALNRWPFATLETHRRFGRSDLAGALGCAGFLPASVVVRRVQVARRIGGFVATARTQVSVDRSCNRPASDPAVSGSASPRLERQASR
jgi:SAM-dependent methyltransferase